MSKTSILPVNAADSAGVAEELLQALSDGIIGVDRTGCIVYINPAARELLGWVDEGCVGLPLDSVFCLNGDIRVDISTQRLRQILDSGLGLGPITNCRVVTRQDQELAVDFSLTPVSPELGMVLFHKIQRGRWLQRRMLYQVSHDSLTGLPNRTALQQTLTQLHAEITAHDDVYTVLLLDLDRFKLINDSYGHSIGDSLLAEVAHRLAGGMRAQDSLGRWGGEEFLCLLPQTDRDHGLRIAERMRKRVESEPFRFEGHLISTTLSVGVAGFPQDGAEPTEVLRMADAALYEAKRSGRNRVQSSEKISGNIFSIASRLEQALSEKRVQPAFQPIVELASGKIVAEESLARIVDSTGEITEAGYFMEAATQLQMVHRIDHEMIRQTIMRCSCRVGQNAGPIAHFVNVSADLLRHPDLIHDILSLAKMQCAVTGFSPDATKPLVIEITERELLENVRDARRILAPFLDFGLRLAIDDFGSGYSSLQYLADLPVAFLKIEGDLVRRAPDDVRVRAILRGVQDMARDLDVITIAEYIENERILEVVRELGVHWGQGYYFGRPRLE